MASDHTLLVLGENLQFVERQRFGVGLPRQRIEFHPCRCHQRGVLVVLQVGVFGIGVRFVDSVYSHRICREQSAVDISVAMLYLVEFALQGTYAVLHYVVLDFQFAVLAADNRHFRSEREIRECRVEQRYGYESEQQFAQQAVTDGASASTRIRCDSAVVPFFIHSRKTLLYI